MVFAYFEVILTEPRHVVPVQFLPVTSVAPRIVVSAGSTTPSWVVRCWRGAPPPFFFAITHGFV